MTPAIPKAVKKSTDQALPTIGRAVPEETTDRSPRNAGRWWWPVTIAVVFAAWAMRTVGAYAVVQTDAARHAMNGVFLRDLIARGKFNDILPFARTYFAHLPALSMPYHPPLFPAIEALFYFAFGVNAFTARLTVALAVAISAILLFRIVKSSHGSTLIATVSTITFLCLPQALWLGSDVMLEFPALVFTLLAILCLQPVDTEYSMKRALLFSLLAGAAVWTKQQAVFLGVLPFVYIAFLGRWRLFLKVPIWISSALFGAFVIGLSSLSLPFQGTGITQAIPTTHERIYLRYMRLFWRNLTFYSAHYPETVGVAGLILLGALAVALVVGLFRRRAAGLYGAWAITSLLVLLFLRPFSTRYLFLTYPALITLGYVALFRIVNRVSRNPRWAATAVVAVFTIAVLWQFPYRTFYVQGPDAAARWLAARDAKRILYCGETDGNFIFSYRSNHPALDTVVIAADKLPAAVFTPAGMEQFAHDYGVHYILVEDVATTGRPWTKMTTAPAASMVEERQFPMRSSIERWNGALRIYRFTNPSATPKDVLSMKMWMIGLTMEFKLDR